MIDTHAHIVDSAFFDVEEVLSRAENCGVKNVFVIGSDLDSSLKAAAFAKTHNSCFFAAGVHPSDCETFDNRLIDGLLPLFVEEKCVAVGEIGVDFHYGADNREKQIEVFKKQIELANEFSLPFIVHSRDASAVVAQTITENKGLISNGFLMHCYSESKEQAKRYLDAGGYFAFGGAVTFKNAKKEDIIRYIPQDRVLCETDCPYMAPVPHRGERNEPAFVVEVYKKLAEIYGVDLQAFEERVNLNAATLFKKAANKILNAEA